MLSIDEKKSVGLDRKPNNLLKIASHVVAPSLTAKFATSISMLPQEWKTSRVSPVYKSGTRNNPSNHRPIFVISTVYDQLYEYLSGSSLLNVCQSGFRSLHSTLTALLEATNSWSINIDNGIAS